LINTAIVSGPVLAIACGESPLGLPWPCIASPA
jgi:hypothetical protein